MTTYTSEDGMTFEVNEESDGSQEPSKLIFQESSSSENKTSALWWVLSVGMVGLVLGTGYYFYQENQKKYAIKSRVNSMLDDLEREENLISEASSEDTQSERLGQLANSDDWRVRSAVASNPGTPAIMMGKLAQDENINVRRKVAYNPYAPTYLLRFLSQDPSSFVREALAFNRQVPLDVLNELRNDRHPAVRRAAKRESQSLEDSMNSEPPQQEDRSFQENPRKDARDIILFHCGPSGIQSFDWLNSTKRSGTIGPGVYFSPIEEDVKKYCDRKHESGTSIYTVSLHVNDKLLINAHDKASEHPFLVEALSTVNHPNKDHWNVSVALDTLLKIMGPHWLVEKVKTWGMIGTYGYFSDGLTEYAILDPRAMRIIKEDPLFPARGLT